ncbi:MAG TPA: DUF4157 domain-containing protein [Myxococcales bacterium]|nr:DUF4157 domain-containing protein [Myxococcales bacterium]
MFDKRTNQNEKNTVQEKPKTSQDHKTVMKKEAAAHSGYQAQREALKPDDAPVQLQGTVQCDSSRVHELAQEGTTGAGGPMPHLDAIQSSFGRHDVSTIKAHSGGRASETAQEMGAQAYATGNNVVFGTGSPSLHTAAHEAAHTLQQKAGVSIPGGVGNVGDTYERHADSVADAVVAGKSSETLLDKLPGSGSSTGVQHKLTNEGTHTNTKPRGTGYPIDEALPADAEAPAYGEDAGAQRRYSVEQYIAMWEAERGIKMTAAQKKNLDRGCIGITAINIDAINPPLTHAYATFEQTKAVVDKWNTWIERHKNQKRPGTNDKWGDYKSYLFAKLFWSNQDPDREKRKKPNNNAFKPNPRNGKIDMNSYQYRSQPGYINFDYGFWDESSNSFWHANHSQPGMKVYQSTREVFERGYADFDRIIFCPAIAKRYDPRNSATRSN